VFKRAVKGVYIFRDEKHLQKDTSANLHSATHTATFAMGNGRLLLSRTLAANANLA
jgi:hypothetical protein